MKGLSVPFCSHALLEVGLEVVERNGRHEETRTPDLYRVKVAL